MSTRLIQPSSPGRAARHFHPAFAQKGRPEFWNLPGMPGVGGIGIGVLFTAAPSPSAPWIKGESDVGGNGGNSGLLRFWSRRASMRSSCWSRDMAGFWNWFCALLAATLPIAPGAGA